MLFQGKTLESTKKPHVREFEFNPSASARFLVYQQLFKACTGEFILPYQQRLHLVQSSAVAASIAAYESLS
jgi:hypothetical protein